MLDGTHLYLVLTGLLAGILGGSLGIGGSVLMIPAMWFLLGPNQHLYQGAAMIVNFFVVLPAIGQHYRAGAIVPPVVRMTIPAAAVGVLGGVWLSNGPWFQGHGELYLTRLFGGFLIYAAAYNLVRLLSSHRLPEISQEAALAIPKWKSTFLVGLPMGLSAGLLGIGGGTLAVPLQQLFLRMPLRRAIANSAATIVLTSVIGAIYKNHCNSQWNISLAETIRLAALLIPSAMVGGWLGGRLTHVLPRRALRIAIILLMSYAGFRMLSRPARGPVGRPATAAQPDVDTIMSEGKCSWYSACAVGADSTNSGGIADSSQDGDCVIHSIAVVGLRRFSECKAETVLSFRFV